MLRIARACFPTHPKRVALALLVFAAAACGDSGGRSVQKDDPDTGPSTDAAQALDAEGDGAAAGGALADAAPVSADAGRPEDGAASPADVSTSQPDTGRADASLPDAHLATPPPQLQAVDTHLGQPVTTAGVANRATCEVLDTEGVAVPGIETHFEVRPGFGWRPGENPGELVGSVAGTYTVTCVAPGEGLRDATPARWDVFPGPAAHVVARVDHARVVAGDLVSVTCEATDAEGNALPVQDAEVSAAPADAGNEVDGQRITFTRSGRYTVACDLPGVLSTAVALVVVEPALPAALQAALSPDLPVYDVGGIVTYRPIVTDLYGNRIEDLVFAFTAEPALPGFGEGRWELVAEGRYHLSVCTVGPTATGMDLCAAVDILVDAGGPAVGCTAPPPGTMLVLDGPVTLEGTVGDVAGVERVTVDGREVAVDVDGHFSTPVNPAWGLNVHDVVAEDAVGNVASTFCAYFASERYHPEDAVLDDSLQLVLTQGGVDDGPPARPLQSLTDLLLSVINSQGLVDTIDASLRAQNPVVPNECRARVLGLCILSAGAEYRGLRIRGVNTIRSTLVDGGLQVRGRISNLELDVKLLGTITNDGTIFADFIDVDLTFDIGLVDGRPSIAMRQVNAVNVGPISSNFDGFLTGDILDLIFSAFEGTVRNTVAGALRSYLETQIDGLLTGVLGGLDVSSFNSALSLPSLGGGPPVDLRIAFGLNAMTADPQKLRLGIATRVNGGVGEAAESAGVPLPPGPVAVALAPNGTAGVSVSIGLVNQVLHGLWRAGMFRIDAGAGGLGNLPPGASLSLRVLLPPAAIGTGADDNGLRLFLGPATGSILYPGLFDEPLQVQIAASALAAVELRNGNEIQFGGEGGILVDRLALTVEGIALTPETRATLEGLFRNIVQSLLDSSLSGALPSLPVPDFALPDSLVMFGIPPGTRLGLRQLVLDGTPSHWLVDGVFSE